MAIELKLFERVESGKGLFAVESISLIYNALTTILILLLYPRMDHHKSERNSGRKPKVWKSSD